MPSVTYAYSVGQEVFHMNEQVGVRDAIVRALSIQLSQSGTILSYDVVFKKPSEGSAIVTEPTLFPDVDSALAAYKPTVIVP